MKNYLAVILLVFLCVHSVYAKDDNKDKKIQKAITKEEHRFQNDLEKEPNNANIYWRHANQLATYNSEFKRALSFYQKAISIDSVNALIYKDYGRYLFDKLHSPDEAKSVLTKGLQFDPNNEDMNKCLESVNKAIEKRGEEAKLKDFGRTTIRELNPNSNYQSLSNFDSLEKIIFDAGNTRNYQKLFGRFQRDDATLTPEDMYLLIIGYAKQKEYNPFNYNDINALRMLASYDLDSAINKGNELVYINPLNPSLNRELMYYYRKKNDVTNADKFMKRIQQFFNGVLYSGNGSCDRPYISLWSKEINTFISYIGYQHTDNHMMGTCAGQMAEIVEMTDPKTKKTENIYFNLKLVYIQTTGK